MARPYLSLVALALAVAAPAAPCLAASPTSADPDAALARSIPARLVIGFKAGFGGTLWTEPDNTTLHTFETGPRAGERFDLPLFDETRGGYTLSSGAFIEGIFFDNLGLEIGASFVQHNLLEKIDWSYVETVTRNGVTSTSTFDAKSEHLLSWTALHVPILVKAIIPSGKTRISLGVGPEFAFGSWSRAKFDITGGGVTGVACQGVTDDKLRLPGSRCAFESLRSKLEDSVYLTVNFGIEIVAGDFLIPIDIHWSYNFSQPPDYLDRAIVDAGDGATIPTDADQDLHPRELTLRTRDNMYGGLRIGLAYQFD